MQAFQDQTLIGWDQFLRGRIGKKGSVGYGVSSGMSAVSKLQITSAVGLLTSLWKFRYGEVNGHTAEEEKGKNGHASPIG